MKQIKKILCMIMTIAFVFTFACPLSTADAATKTISEGKWVKAHSEKDYYKVTVEKEGYITLTSKSDYGVPYYEILNSKKHVFSDNSFVDGGGNGGNKTIKVAVSKGTYYIHYFGDEENDTARVKYTFTPIKQKTNYCKAKAIKLRSGYRTRVYQTPKYSFDRFYKITVTSKKKITIYTNSEIDIFSSKWKPYDTTIDFGNNGYDYKYRTEKKLPKGTYYLILRVHEPGKSAIVPLKWQ